jgi:hypothetical protein
MCKHQYSELIKEVYKNTSITNFYYLNNKNKYYGLLKGCVFVVNLFGPIIHDLEKIGYTVSQGPQNIRDLSNNSDKNILLSIDSDFGLFISIKSFELYDKGHIKR